MATEENTLPLDLSAAAPAPASAAASAGSEDAPAKPARRGRKPKAASEDAPVEASATDEAAAPKKRTYTRRKKVEADAEVSPEIAQARALAQVSQAQVAREERKRAERTEELLAGEDVPATPKKRTYTRRKKADVEAAEVQEASAAMSEAPVADATEVSVKPARRGRKPKAVVEAEAAAAAAAAASAPEGESAPAAVPETTAAPAPVEAAPTEDVRPGRARRGRKPAAEAQADAAVSDDAAAAKADTPAAVAEATEPAAASDADSAEPAREGKRRQHKDRRDRDDKNRDDKNRDRNDRGDRNDRRRERQQRNKQRNNRYNNAPVEPSLTREELSEMKVAELREKGKEFDLDVAGKKKAELVEEIYAAAARAEGFRDIKGILDIANDGFGYIRAHGYMPSRDDAFVPANMIRAARLRAGDLIEGTLRPSRANDKFPGLAKIRTINGLDPEEIRQRPKFAELTPIYPNEPLKMEHGRDSITGRAIDIVSPIGKGQRGLIVSPPKAGKTTILKKICQSIAANNPEVYLICLLVDERPEEVTDMERSIKGDVVASTFDMPADNHTRVSELVIERAKRIVELGGDVVVVLDSITRLARAYNLAAPASGRILSGGVDSAALYPPKRFLGAARNIENGGSLTILASALIDTGSKMDEVIFEEFKGTGNMELKLDRDLADRRIFPAIDPVASGTRNEDLLIDESMRPFVWGIRRILANMSNTERAAAAFIKGLKGTNTNEEFLIRSAKKAADHEASM